LGNPKSHHFGKLPTGERFEEWNYGDDSLMITFFQGKARRFSIVPDEKYAFPHQVDEALSEWNIKINKKPTYQNDYYIKWKNPSKSYSLVTVTQKDNTIQYINVIIK